jgi:hypothetical protein
MASGSTVLIPSETSPPCRCGAVKVSIYKDQLEKLMDNMGSELGLEFLAGPFCPRCEAEAIRKVGQGVGSDSWPREV